MTRKLARALTVVLLSVGAVGLGANAVSADTGSKAPTVHTHSWKPCKPHTEGCPH